MFSVAASAMFVEGEYIQIVDASGKPLNGAKLTSYSGKNDVFHKDADENGTILISNIEKSENEDLARNYKNKKIRF